MRQTELSLIECIRANLNPFEYGVQARQFLTIEIRIALDPQTIYFSTPSVTCFCPKNSLRRNHITDVDRQQKTNNPPPKKTLTTDNKHMVYPPFRTCISNSFCIILTAFLSLVPLPASLAFLGFTLYGS